MTNFQNEQMKKKIPFASLVLENKELLFGNFDDAKGISRDSK